MIKRLVFYLFKYMFMCLFSALYTLRALYQMYKTKDKPIEPIDLSKEPSCLQNPTLGKHGSIRLKKRDIEVHYVAKGDRSKPLILFVHGFPEFWYTWKYQLLDFGKDYYAVAMDMTGYGGTSKPTDVNRYFIDELAADVKEFIVELGFESCILVSHDWGGAVCYNVSMLYPEVVERLIVLNCPNKRGMMKGLSFKQLLKSSYMFYFQIPIIPEFFLSRKNCAALDMMRKGPMACKNKATLTQEDLNAYKYTFMKGGFTGPLNYYRMSMSSPPYKKDSRKSKKITVPSLIIWGTDDGALGTELAKYSAESMEKCDVEYVDGASHWVNVERPDEVNQIIRDYLAKSE